MQGISSLETWANILATRCRAPTDSTSLMSDVLVQSCRLVSAASSTLGAFAIGAIGSVAGTIVAWLLIGQRLGPDGWKVSALFFLSVHIIPWILVRLRARDYCLSSGILFDTACTALHTACAGP